MYREIQLSSWSDFEKEIQTVLNGQREGLVSSMQVPLIFRGQADSDWHLETTLERNVGKNIKFNFYFPMIGSFLNEMETFTEKHWEFSEKLVSSGNIPEEIVYWYDYMTYLRHHGLPSPLLDWTYSPFVAAYFAFRDIGSNAKNVSIYVYAQNLESKLKVLPLWSLENVRNNKRHYLQQSVYTICVKKEKDTLYFADHEEELFSEDPSSDYLTKYIIPASERGLALMGLEPYNINAYSLMGNEEGLLETLFLRYISIRKARKELFPNWVGNDY